MVESKKQKTNCSGFCWLSKWNMKKRIFNVLNIACNKMLVYQTHRFCFYRLWNWMAEWIKESWIIVSYWISVIYFSFALFFWRNFHLFCILISCNVSVQPLDKISSLKNITKYNFNCHYEIVSRNICWSHVMLNIS